jgi:hypothetical protein
MKPEKQDVMNVRVPLNTGISHHIEQDSALVQLRQYLAVCVHNPEIEAKDAVNIKERVGRSYYLCVNNVINNKFTSEPESASSAKLTIHSYFSSQHIHL